MTYSELYDIIKDFETGTIVDISTTPGNSFRGEVVFYGEWPWILSNILDGDKGPGTGIWKYSYVVTTSGEPSDIRAIFPIGNTRKSYKIQPKTFEEIF